MDAQVLVEVRVDADARARTRDPGAPNKHSSTLNRLGALAALVAMVSTLAAGGLDRARAATPALRLTPLDEARPAPLLAGRPCLPAASPMTVRSTAR